jgi:uncharacterized protein with NRDE domain
MCIVVFQWQPESHEPLTLAANRDEFFARPTAAMDWWPETQLLAGRDLQGGGTWFGITRSGRFALLTNVRDPSKRKSNAPTRGLIVREFLEGEMTPEAYVRKLAEHATRYEGFNFIAGALTTPALWFVNSNERRPQTLPPGVYTLSNASLDTPWPKTEQLRRDFAEAISAKSAIDQSDALQTILRHDARVTDDRLPSTGVPLEWERALSSVFIRHEHYGTRASTTLRIQKRSVEVREVTHLRDQVSASENRFAFEFCVEQQST